MTTPFGELTRPFFDELGPWQTWPDWDSSLDEWAAFFTAVEDIAVRAAHDLMHAGQVSGPLWESIGAHLVEQSFLADYWWLLERRERTLRKLSKRSTTNR